MQLQDIKHLAILARLDISDEEAEGLLHDLEATLAYVDQVTKAPVSGMETSVSEHRNVMRDDVVTTQTGSYTDALISAAPMSQDGFVKVKKIL
jgi:aspartyl-tRNA(Asn)/glutamyl-tRNA(Gln) amidotransferase subunit C